MAVNIAVTPTTLVQNTGTICTAVAIDADTATLTITPGKSCRKLVLILTNGGAGYDVGLAAGHYWAAKAMTAVTMGSEARAFTFESARYADYVGASTPDTITITLGAAATTTTTYICLELP